MKCVRVKDLLAEYVDGELDRPLQEDVRQHLDACAKCRQAQEVLISAVIEPLEKAGKAKVPDEIWGRVRNRIEEQEEARPVFFRQRRPAAAIAAALAVILIAVIFTRPPSDGTDAIDAYMEEQLEFLSYLTDDTEAGYTGIETGDLGTTIEEYLL